MFKQKEFNQACVDGDFNAVKRLMNDPIVDVAHSRNRAIRWASRNGHLEIVKLLLEDPRLQFKDMNSPIVEQLERDCDELRNDFKPIKKVMLEIVKEREAEAEAERERERIRKRDVHIWDDSVLF